MTEPAPVYRTNGTYTDAELVAETERQRLIDIRRDAISIVRTCDRALGLPQTIPERKR